GHPRNHRWLPDRGGGLAAARRRRRAGCAAKRSARLSHRALRRTRAADYPGAGRSVAYHEGQSKTDGGARRGAALPALFVRARRGDSADRRRLNHSTFAGSRCKGEALAIRAAFAMPARAATFFCWSVPGCTTPQDMISVAASSALMSTSMILL